MALLVRRQLHEQCFSQAQGFMDFPVLFFCFLFQESMHELCLVPNVKYGQIIPTNNVPEVSAEQFLLSQEPVKWLELPLYTVKYNWYKKWSQILVSVSKYLVLQNCVYWEMCISSSQRGKRA